MALFKAAGDWPDQGLRLDGAVWSEAGPGATIRGWVSPHMRYSTQFERYDRTAADLGVYWGDLAAAEQEGWAELGNAVPALAGCRRAGGYYGGGGGNALGSDVFAAVNLARCAQGLGVVRVAPESKTRVARDRISLLRGGEPPAPIWPLAVNPLLLWERDAPPGGGPHCALVWARSRVTAPTGGGSRPRYRLLGRIDLEPDDPAAVSLLMLAGGVVVPGGTLCVECGICELGLGPIILLRASLRNLAL